MKKIKMSLLMFAVVLGVGSAFATKSKAHRIVQQYANTSLNGTTHWIVNTRAESEDPGDYSCDLADKPCTAYFSSQPADGTAAPVSPDTEPGQYLVNQ